MRRDPREDSRGLVDPRDAPELLDNDGYGLHGEEEVMYGYHAGPAAAGGGHRPDRNAGAATRGGHKPNRNPGRGQRGSFDPREEQVDWGRGQGQRNEYGPWHEIMFEAFGNFHCQGGGCAWGEPCDRHKEQFLMMNCQTMGYHGPWDPERVREFLRPHYDFMKGSLAYYAAERGFQATAQRRC